MSEIYYNNLGEFKNVPKIMSDVFDGLSPFYKYLSLVEQHLKEQVVSFHFVYLDASPLEVEEEEEKLLESSVEKLNTDNEAYTDTNTSSEYKQLEGYWIQLDDEEIESNNSLVEEIFTQRVLFDRKPEGRYWNMRDGIRVIESYPKYAAFHLEKKPEKRKLHLRPNTYQIERIIAAIRLIQDRPSTHHVPLIKLFQQVLTHVDWPEFTPPRINKFYFLQENRSGVEIQREFTAIALGTPDFAILNGPPGTGKTQVICEIILQEVLRGKKVILVASTHIAVDNVLERIIANPAAEQVIFPIRIGDEKNISDDLKKFMYSTMRKTERDRIREKLSNLKQRNPAQNILYDALGKSGSENIIDQVILDAANLVCGTSIGILQYPPIKYLQNSMPEPIFDVMILDEASKTPFYEFLVPALYARKWVVTGDPKQLSPFVNELDIEVSIDSLLTNFKVSQDTIQATLPFLTATKRRNFHLVLSDSWEIIELYKKHTHKIRKDKEIICRVSIVSDLLSQNIEPKVMEYLFWTSHLLICHVDELAEINEYLPSDLKLRFHLKNDSLQLYSLLDQLPREFLQKILYTSSYHATHYLTKYKDDWYHELSYRLTRKFELRNDKNRGDYLEREIRILTPPVYEFDRNLKNIRQVFFPSVLESLLEGFELGTDRGMGTTLTDGLPDDARELRFRLLKYQHRMHSQISKFPSKYIYEGESLLNSSGMDQRREPWIEATRIKWLQVRRKDKFEGREPTYNHAETEAIRQELIAFEKWADFNRKADGEKWTVAVLTFYRGQEKELRHMLRKLYNKHSVWRTFYRKSIKVEVCTVDRFQGHEADLVYLSFVNNTRSGFLDVPNRLNVAITRARYQLILVGYQKYFASKRCPSEYLNLLARKIKKIDVRYEND